MAMRRKGQSTRPATGAKQGDGAQAPPPVADTMPAAVEAPPETSLIAGSASDTPPMSLHEALLESVSPEALAVDPPDGPPDVTEAAAGAPVPGTPAPEPEAENEPATAEAPVQAASETQNDGADEASAPAEPPEASDRGGAAEPVPVAVAEAVSDAVPTVVAPTALASATSAPEPPLPGQAATPALSPILEIQTAMFAFVRGEGAAALTHLRALSRARTPTEVMRLQMDEFQRAADASLSCASDIVRSAQRLAPVVPPRRL